MANPSAVSSDRGSTPAPRKVLSPHLGVWRWHVTMAISIFHRGAGLALGVAALGMIAWIGGVFLGPKAFKMVCTAASSLPGKTLLFFATLGFFFHAFNGMRHLVWDLGRGLKPKTAELTAWLVMIAALIANIVLWRDWFFY